MNVYYRNTRKITFNNVYIYIVSDKFIIDAGFLDRKQDVKKEEVEDWYQESLTYEVKKVRPMMK